MKSLLMILVVVGLIGFSPLAFSQSNGYKAWIVVEAQGRHVTIKPLCYAPEDAVVQYKLWVKKSGKSGKSTSCQSGTVRLLQGEEKCLAQSALGISPDDQYQIKLEVYRDGKLIAEDHVSYP